MEELRSYDILDSAPEETYDDLCFLASKICDTEIAAITFIDEDRQWFKAKLGLDDTETSREHAFCAHAICDPDDVMVVGDATEDERFQDNPYVQGDPEIRFYAGAPLQTPDGRGLGTICAIDTEPRSITEEQRRGLEALSRMVMTQLELRRRSRQVREIKEAMEEANQQLRLSNQDLEQFASAISHDVREPLRMISSYLDLIDRRGGDELPEELQEFLAYARDGAERLDRMIHGLLAFSRVDRKGGALEPFPLEDAVEGARRNLSEAIREEDAEVTADPPMPEVVADQHQVTQVLQNLVSNAIQYSGDDLPVVRVRSEVTGALARVHVEDEGVGIPEEEAEHVFSMFKRGSSGRRSREGDGVGLALCKRIVERHGGEIWVESTPGEGSTFSFTLPAELEAVPHHLRGMVSSEP